LRNDIVALVESKKSDVSIAVVGAEAATEADHILSQAANMLQLRRELLKASSGKIEAEKELRSLEGELAAAGSDAERKALQSALEARQAELSHYADADSANERIVAGLRQAEAALSEMKARLTTAAANGADAVEEEGELRETIGRLKSLGTSLDEAEAWLRKG
jgi:chromosome segregation ATPase